jgi:adenylylsulfate kinase
MTEKLHIIPHNHAINKVMRNELNGHQSFTVWFCGLSGSGKSTIANEVEKYLFAQNCKTYILDGDNVRKGLNSNLDFSEVSRKENLRRVAEVSKLMVDAGLIVLTAFISPFEEERAFAKNIIGPDNFVEVFIDTPLEVCEQRDVKGLYQKARSGEISNFTGISSPFEPPTNPDIIVKTANRPLEDCVLEVINYLKTKNLIN